MQLAESLKKAQRDIKETVWRTYKNVMLLGKDGVNPDSDYYVKKMRANLDALAKALP